MNQDACVRRRLGNLMLPEAMLRLRPASQILRISPRHGVSFSRLAVKRLSIGGGGVSERGNVRESLTGQKPHVCLITQPSQNLRDTGQRSCCAGVIPAREMIGSTHSVMTSAAP